MSPALFVALILVCASIFVNGWTDAPNAIATVVSTRVLSPRVAVVMATIFNLVGIMCFGSAVASTIANLVDVGTGSNPLIAICAAQLSIVIWSVSAWRFGIPTSESHALIAGLMGSGIAYNGLSAFKLAEFEKVLWGIFISTFVGFIAAYLVTKLIGYLFRRVKRAKANRFFSIGQIASAALMATSHGAQDGQKFMGVFVLVILLAHNQPIPSTVHIDVWIMLLCSLVMAIGTSIGGYRIIKTMGVDMVKLEKYQGFSAEIVASLCMLITTVKSGIPLSTTNTKGTAMMGAGAARRFSDVNWSIAKEMVMAWVLTFPACMILGYVMTKLFILIF
ncbi:inorganic phosphate transporter [Caproiciproducens galactitolivorans]|uniref:Inorganic phosphate transporter n=1 Tax=Caproiciproducens galactitolivorans TaxID=642589 RepID=A0ABT4BSX4_9FIRM|nr:inorganic phosphate transporter [Caproiciproducens galactitolivorans]MCY1714001.1 inorganic phosphate transporter [Caproiciproducens galactitolivorans]